MDRFKILKFLSHNLLATKGTFDIPQQKQEYYLWKLKEPKDTIERSYLQYKCQFYFVPAWRRLLLNTMSLFVIWIWILKMFFCKKEKKESVEAIIGTKGYREKIIPPSFEKRFNQIQEVDWTEGSYISMWDWNFLFVIAKRYPMSGWFLLKNFMRISNYSFIIEQYNPQFIIDDNESSFTSSMLTEYCRKKGIRHIDIMHGEKLYNIRDSFFEFDEIYVWDEHYIRLFQKLRAKTNQYHIELPPAILIDAEKFRREDCYCDLKYYATYQTKDELRQIRKIFDVIESKGLKCCLRLHPRYSDVDVVKQYFRQDQMEASYFTIEESLVNCRYVVGLYSTVLLQGYYIKKELILDDVVYGETLKKLYEYDYLLLSKPYRLLSEFISTNNQS